MLERGRQQHRSQHWITKAVKLRQYQQCASLPEHTQAASPSFLPPLKEAQSVLLSSSHSYSEPADRCQLLYFHIYLCSLWAWYDLCSPSHLIITLFPHSSFFTPLCFSSSSSSPLLLSPRFSPQSSLSNGDKGRPADYLSNGKKRKADEKEFMTDYVRHFQKSVKCFSNWRKLSPTASSPGHMRPADCGQPLPFQTVIEILPFPVVITALLWQRRLNKLRLRSFLGWDEWIVDRWAPSFYSRPLEMSKTSSVFEDFTP